MGKRNGLVAALGMMAVSTGGSLHGAQAAAAVPPTRLGINISPPRYWVPQRIFANLVLGARWQSRLPEYKMPGPDFIDKNGVVRVLPGGQPVWRMLSQPDAPEDEADMRCTYAGKGRLEAELVKNVSYQPNSFTFHWSRHVSQGKVLLKLSETDPSDPIRSIDCRETNLPQTARFAPGLVQFLKGFQLVRFMDWQNSNDNRPVTWATRHTPESMDVMIGDGVSIEDMVDLANLVGVDAWFNMPWNADEDYVRRFAKMVHDGMPANRTVYVELGNEIWNLGFPATRQAKAEGVAEGLSPDPNIAALFRYAERTAQVMDIWAKAFADRPNRLVRVAASQNGPWPVEKVLSFRDTAKHVDAVATAPYFGHELAKQPPANVDEAFQRLDVMVNQSLDKALAVKAVAAKYGKRYITYEGGQHVVLKDNMDLSGQIQRDQRMYQYYMRYLEFWRANVGDTIVLFNSVSPVSKFGSWGLSEYLGQPLSEAPKLRAVRDFTAKMHR